MHLPFTIKNMASEEIDDNSDEQMTRLARIWKDSRMSRGKSQDYMASQLGVSKKTIQNWEKGTSIPDCLIAEQWFRILDTNPLPFYLAFKYPDYFTNAEEEGESKKSDDVIAEEQKENDKVNHALELVLERMTLQEKEQLLFILAGSHGSPRHSLLQMFTAHCHTTLKSRVAAARVVLDNYEMEEQTDVLVGIDAPMPNIELLRMAIEAGKQAVQRNEQSYTNF